MRYMMLIYTNETDPALVPAGELESVLGRPPRDFADYAREAAATGVWGGVPTLSGRDAARASSAGS